MKQKQQPQQTQQYHRSVGIARQFQQHRTHHQDQQQRSWGQRACRKGFLYLFAFCCALLLFSVVGFYGSAGISHAQAASGIAGKKTLTATVTDTTTPISTDTSTPTPTDTPTPVPTTPAPTTPVPTTPTPAPTTPTPTTCVGLLCPTPTPTPCALFIFCSTPTATPIPVVTITPTPVGITPTPGITPTATPGTLGAGTGPNTPPTATPRPSTSTSQTLNGSGGSSGGGGAGSGGGGNSASTNTNGSGGSGKAGSSGTFLTVIIGFIVVLLIVAGTIVVYIAYKQRNKPATLPPPVPATPLLDAAAAPWPPFSNPADASMANAAPPMSNMSFADGMGMPPMQASMPGAMNPGFYADATANYGPLSMNGIQEMPPTSQYGNADAPTMMASAMNTLNMQQDQGMLTEPAMTELTLTPAQSQQIEQQNTMSNLTDPFMDAIIRQAQMGLFFLQGKDAEPGADLGD